MNCKRCGSVLPSKGYICLECGAMMDEEQIKVQQENLKKQPQNNRTFSDNYNIDKNIKPREENDRSLPIAAFIIVVVFLVVISILIFLLKK